MNTEKSKLNLRKPKTGFKPMDNRKPIIDVETLEVWDSLKDCAEALGVSCPYLVQAINMKYRVGGGMGFTKQRHGHLLEYFSYWLKAYSAKEKAKYCRNKQFDFMEGKEDENKKRFTVNR